MKPGQKMVAALITATATTTPVAGHAQSGPSEPPRATDQTLSPNRAEEEAQEQPQFLDQDGNPLPSDIQDDLKKQFEERLAPTPDSKAHQREIPVTAPSPTGGDILVTGQRPRGSVTSDIPPERTFSAIDIMAYGVGSIRELIESVAPQVSSSNGEGNKRPVTLLNGRRVSSFSEIAEIPAEAIERMEVFPEELALEYGYQADQKVVNIVTFERFRSILGRLNTILATEGGYDNSTGQSSYFAIRGDTRFDFGAEYSRSASLLESERNLIQRNEMPDASRFRTLVPDTERLVLNGLISGNVLSDMSSTLNGRFEKNSNTSLLGQGAVGPLTQTTDTDATHLGTTLHGRMDKWLWTFTSNYDRFESEVVTDVADGQGHAQSVNSYANATFFLSGPLLELPSGPISTSLRSSVDLRDFSSTSQFRDLQQQAEFSRNSAALQVNLSMPLTRLNTKAGAILGKLSVNANLQIEKLSDFGTLRTFGYGLNWSPTEAINVTASFGSEQRAPTMEQLGAPVVLTPNVRIFDFTRSEVVDIAQIFGGNPTLQYDDRRIFRLGIDAKPIATSDFTLSFDYVSTQVDNPIVPFPIATPAIEAAFPERFTRNDEGRLLQIDSRPINFENSRREQLRWGINFIRPLGKVESWMRSGAVRTYSSETEARASVSPDTIVAMVQPGSAMARRFENLSSRIYLSAYHTWRLQDEINIEHNLPSIDLLNGGAIDPRGGTRRHELELQAGIFKKGLGGRATLNWQSKTKIRNLAGASDLTFSDLATVNIDLFMNITDQVGASKAPKWLKGARATFSVTNLFNTRQQVRDQTGSIPLNYQPAYLDPLGRLVSLGFRMVF